MASYVIRNKASWDAILREQTGRGLELWKFEAGLELKLGKDGNCLVVDVDSIKEKYDKWTQSVDMASYKEEINLIIGLAYKVIKQPDKVTEHFQQTKLKGQKRGVRNLALSAELAFEEVEWVKRLLEGLQKDSHYREFVSDVVSKCFWRACLMYLESSIMSSSFEFRELVQPRNMQFMKMNTGFFKDEDRRTDGQYLYGDVENLEVLKKGSLLRSTLLSRIQSRSKEVAPDNRSEENEASS